jgi:putative transposase
LEKPSTKGTGFVQPIGPHGNWQADVSCVNVAGRFFLITIVVGYSQLVVHWELGLGMTECNTTLEIQFAKKSVQMCRRESSGITVCSSSPRFAKS